MTEDRSDRTSLFQFMLLIGVMLYLLGFVTGALSR